MYWSLYTGPSTLVPVHRSTSTTYTPYTQYEHPSYRSRAGTCAVYEVGHTEAVMPRMPDDDSHRSITYILILYLRASSLQASKSSQID